MDSLQYFTNTNQKEKKYKKEYPTKYTEITYEEIRTIRNMTIRLVH